MQTTERKDGLSANERVWPLKPEVLLARGKCDIQGREEKAIRGAIKEAVTTYRKEAVMLEEKNMGERKRMVQLLNQSSEEAEEILLRKCDSGQQKLLKYRGKDAQNVSDNIDEEVALLRNVLNDLTNKKNQRTRTLLDQQRRLAAMQVNEETGGDENPEEERRCRALECQLEKTSQKMACSVTCKKKYQDFIDILNTEKASYENRLNKQKKIIQQDINDLEVCQDIMMKGYILGDDAVAKRVKLEAKCEEEKKERENSIKRTRTRREVFKKDTTAARKKATITDVDLEKVLKDHQNMFAQLKERRRTLVELDTWSEQYEALQQATRATDAVGVTRQFEHQMERHSYLSQEKERMETQRQQQRNLLLEQEMVLSSVLHTGAESGKLLDEQIVQLKERLQQEAWRRAQVDGRLGTVGSSLSIARSSVRQQLQSLKFVSRPQGWTRPPNKSEIAGDLELLRLKVISLQQRYEALGAPLRLDSQSSLRPDAMVGNRNQFRINKMKRGYSAPVES